MSHNTPVLITAALIPDELVSRLQAAGRAGDSAAFEIGEITNVLLDELDAELKDYSRMSVYAAVGTWAGCAAETVRMRAHVEAAVPKWVRNKWDELYFHQFKALVPHVPHDADWEPTIEAWLEHCVTSGKKVSSVDGIRVWLKGKKDPTSPGLAQYRKFVALAFKLLDYTDLPKFVTLGIQDLLAWLEADGANTEWEVEKR